MIALDDNIEDHPKFVGLSPAAAWLWVRCVGYCRRNKTDGFIPEPAALARGTKKAIAELVSPAPAAPTKAPLWSAVPGGYQVHDYLDWNPSAVEVEAKREQKRSAGRSGGEASGEARRKRIGIKAEAEAKHGASGSFANRSTKTNPSSGSGSGSVDPPVVPQGTQPSLEDLLGPADPPKPSPIDAVWAAYVEAHERHHGKRSALTLNDARRGLIRRRLKDHSADQLAAAARGVFRDTWCVERQKWEPEWVWQNAGNVERFAALGAAGAVARPSATEDPDESERRRLGPAPKAAPVERAPAKPWDELDHGARRLWGTREAYEAKCAPRSA